MPMKGASLSCFFSLRLICARSIGNKLVHRGITPRPLVLVPPVFRRGHSNLGQRMLSPFQRYDAGADRCAADIDGQDCFVPGKHPAWNKLGAAEQAGFVRMVPDRLQRDVAAIGFQQHRGAADRQFTDAARAKSPPITMVSVSRQAFSRSSRRQTVASSWANSSIALRMRPAASTSPLTRSLSSSLRCTLSLGCSPSGSLRNSPAAGRASRRGSSGMRGWMHGRR